MQKIYILSYNRSCKDPMTAAFSAHSSAEKSLIANANKFRPYWDFSQELTDEYVAENWLELTNGEEFFAIEELEVYNEPGCFETWDDLV